MGWHGIGVVRPRMEPGVALAFENLGSGFGVWGVGCSAVLKGVRIGKALVSMRKCQLRFQYGRGNSQREGAPFCLR